MRYADRIIERRGKTFRCYFLPTNIQSVVSFFGSFRSCPRLDAGDDLVQTVTAGLLDRGTRHRDKFAIADILETRGARRSYYSEPLRVGFSGKALSRDVSEVIGIIAEELREPGFAPEEVETMRGLMSAQLHRSLEDTSDLADTALRGSLFAALSPNHAVPIQEQLRRLSALEEDTIRAYHAAHFGPRELLLVFVGDVDVDAVYEAVEGALADWGDHESSDTFDPGALRTPPSHEDVLVDGKPNVDVRMGHTLSLRRQSSDYIPLYVANYILGGNFSARLMQIVRDQLGLTYGIRSALKGVTVDHDGFWEVSVTLSRDMVSRGIDETRKVLDAFVAQGVTEKELQAKKDTITGSFQVGLATTSGLGRSILANVERGFGVEYLDHFPEEIRSATLDEVNSALTRHLRPADLHIARSGSLAAGAEDASITPTP